MSESTLHPGHTSYGTIRPTRRLSETFPSSSDSPTGTPGLHRGLSSRQVQMIAIAGTIGTGLFLGTGRSLAQGGPASMLICHSIVGFIVYVTLVLLGEMATQYPIAGECFGVSPLSYVRRRVVPVHLLRPPVSRLFSVHFYVQSQRRKFFLAYSCNWQFGKPILVICASR
jgi:hypothetical protein